MRGRRGRLLDDGEAAVGVGGALLDDGVEDVLHPRVLDGVVGAVVVLVHLPRPKHSRARPSPRTLAKHSPFMQRNLWLRCT